MQSQLTCLLFGVHKSVKHLLKFRNTKKGPEAGGGGFLLHGGGGGGLMKCLEFQTPAMPLCITFTLGSKRSCTSRRSHALPVDPIRPQILHKHTHPHAHTRTSLCFSMTRGFSLYLDLLFSLSLILSLSLSLHDHQPVTSGRPRCWE